MISIVLIPSPQARGLSLSPASPSNLPHLVLPKVSLCTESPHSTELSTPLLQHSAPFPCTTARLLLRASSEPAGLATQLRCLPDPRPPKESSPLHPTELRHLSASSFSPLSHTASGILHELQNTQEAEKRSHTRAKSAQPQLSGLPPKPSQVPDWLSSERRAPWPTPTPFTSNPAGRPTANKGALGFSALVRLRPLRGGRIYIRDLRGKTRSDRGRTLGKAGRPHRKARRER